MDSQHVDEELTSGGRLILDGRVKDGIERLAALLARIDSTKEKDAYWRVAITLADWLSRTENHAEASQILNAILSTKIGETDRSYFLWMQFHLGRNLYYLGKVDEAEKILRALGAGDARLVHNPAQRAGALILSKIELGRDNIAQAAVWMRRAVIGTMMEKGAGSGEILDVLTEYAIYLKQTRRLSEAINLFTKLAPLYDTNFSHHSPHYLHFGIEFLGAFTALGNFPMADKVRKIMSDNVAAVDIVPMSVREELFFQELYQVARQSLNGQRSLIVERLKKTVSDYPHFLEQPRNRIAFSYFALFGGDVELADQYLAVRDTRPLNAQFAAYEILLQSYISAARNNFDASIGLARWALDKIRSFHQLYENESASRLPAITAEERVILSLIVGMTAPHVSSVDQADTLFQLEQFINRDKGKLGLNQRASREALDSELLREDLRTRDRLLDLRDSVMSEATDTLVSRVLPIRAYSFVKNDDFSFLLRLEDIEDKIAGTNDQLRQGIPEFFQLAADSPVDLMAAQRLLKPNEALILHLLAGGGDGLVTTCIDRNNWELSVIGFKRSDFQKFIIDMKLLSAAVHGTHEPSVQLDGSFPIENSHDVYQVFFGGIGACLRNKSHILLATDPDLFTVPWNALLTEPWPKEKVFQHRTASWLPKTYALSLLPSVRSFLQLRTNLARSQARQKFLGIGDPDFKGSGTQSAQLSLAPLYVARGVANKDAISDLPRLPDSADELRAVAAALKAPNSSLLLGSEATERELRKHALNDYRVISFATHAIVAGEIEGTTEPALVLAPGREQDSSQNDGLLTATEIANLTLDANLVILSACNTAGPDGRASGRGLSGLADAFFFAGSRALVVTQWAVRSEVARELGAGAILKSVNSNAQGISEGLRETIVDYISGAAEDYLANPRFWAAFMIAGDGAVGPLDGVAENESGHDAIRVEWEHVIPESRYDEVYDVSKETVGGSFYAMGLAKPPPGSKRGGSYVARIPKNGQVEITTHSADMAARRITAIGTNLVELGDYPGEHSSTGVFRFLADDGRELWRVEDPSQVWNFPVQIIKRPDGYLLISLETDFFSSAPEPSAIVLTVVSERGSRMMRRHYPIPVKSPTSTPTSLGSDGNIVLAVAGSIPDQAGSQGSRVWTNPLTGSKKFCVGGPEGTLLLAIDPSTLEIRRQKLIQGIMVGSLKSRDRHVYAATNFKTNCRTENTVRLVEVEADFELKSLFESKNINSLDVNDIEITSDGFVLVGRTWSFLPTVLTNKTIVSPEQLKNEPNSDPWDPSFWEKGETRAMGFILVLDNNGRIIADRVFPDLRARSIAKVAGYGNDHFVGVGTAFGDHGWVIAFELRSRLNRARGAVSQGPVDTAR